MTAVNNKLLVFGGGNFFFAFQFPKNKIRRWFSLSKRLAYFRYRFYLFFPNIQNS